VEDVVAYIVSTATPSQLAVFELRIKGFSPAEIAAELGISQHCANVHMTRCRQIAREWERGEIE
jgi:DNA-binding CsgD family transcriptional regulator